MNMKITWLALLLVALLPLTASAVTTDSACAGKANCYNAGNFTATVTSLTRSQSTRQRHIVLIVRFHNTSTKPIVLVYKAQSSSIAGNLGHGYYWGRSGSHDKSAQGIGTVTAHQADTSFVLAPGQARDARFRLTRYSVSRHAPHATPFTYDVTIEQLHVQADGQVRVARQYPVHFANLGRSHASGMATTLHPGNAVVTTAVATPSAMAGTCTGKTACYDAGSFVATVTSLTQSRSTLQHHIKLIIRFSNPTTQPLLLAYKARSSSMVDNLGNGYYWGRSGSHDKSAQGIGMISGSNADASFVLGPGQSRDARFSLTRYGVGGHAQIGNSFTHHRPTATTGNRIHVARQYPVHFANLSAQPHLNPDNNTLNTAAQAVHALEKLKNLFDH